MNPQTNKILFRIYIFSVILILRMTQVEMLCRTWSQRKLKIMEQIFILKTIFRPSLLNKFSAGLFSSWIKVLSLFYFSFRSQFNGIGLGDFRIIVWHTWVLLINMQVPMQFCGSLNEALELPMSFNYRLLEKRFDLSKDYNWKRCYNNHTP